jgi:hypothetical protein
MNCLLGAHKLFIRYFLGYLVADECAWGIFFGLKRPYSLQIADSMVELRTHL